MCDTIKNRLLIIAFSILTRSHCSFAGDITYRDNYSTYVNQAHLKIHFPYDSSSVENQSKLFSCTRCQRKYKFRKTLNRHMNHECGKDKIHTCSFCNYRAYRHDRIMSHVRIVHPSIAPLPKRSSMGKLPKIANVSSIAFQNYWDFF